MNFLKKLFAGVAIIGVIGSASAQGVFDAFAWFRTIVVLQPLNLTATNVVTGNTFTNMWCDTHGFNGICKLDVGVGTNAATGSPSMLVTAQGSVDQTNFVNLANVAVGTNFNVIYTNGYYTWNLGTNIVATNNYNLPGTLSVPTAGTAGYAAPVGEVINPYQAFTNTLTAFALTPGTVTTFAWNVGDGPRYFRLILSPGGTVTNESVSAVLTAHKSGF
jgi:hypothetical protein